MQNYSNLQNLTNYVQSSPQFEKVPFYLLRVNLPGIQSDTEKLSTRGRNRFNTQQELIEFNSLSFEMLIDENLEIWLEMQNYLRERVKKDATFDPDPFTFTVSINNNKGNKLFTVMFNYCYLVNIGDIQLDSTQDQLHHTLQVEITYDDYEIIHQGLPEENNDYCEFNDAIPECCQNCDSCECSGCTPDIVQEGSFLGDESCEPQTLFGACPQLPEEDEFLCKDDKISFEDLELFDEA